RCAAGNPRQPALEGAASPWNRTRGAPYPRGTHRPRPGRPQPPDFAHEAGSGRALARYQRFGYRRRVRGSLVFGQSEGRGGAQGAAKGLRRPGGARSGPRECNPRNPTARAASRGKSVAPEPKGKGGSAFTFELKEPNGPRTSRRKGTG